MKNAFSNYYFWHINWQKDIIIETEWASGIKNIGFGLSIGILLCGIQINDHNDIS